MTLRKPLAAILSLFLVVGVLQFATPAVKAEAAEASQFNPGMIISDALFYDGGAMGTEAVQSFLNSQVRACSAGYTCLKDYRQDTPNRAAVAGRCAAYGGAVGESAASIITKVGVACGISQKALVVLLQKEQGLVTATAPAASKYQIATGYACPDTAACDSTYYGFFNQVYSAASQFKRYSTLPSAFNHIAGRVNNVRLHPNAACGSTQVLIQNNATAGLYNYTPYQPNASALANMYGTGDGCASYGNRNFWRYYTDWFGSTTVTNLVRTLDNAAVYLIVDDVKHLVPDMKIFTALSPLGGISFVSQTYISSLDTGVAINRTVRESTGSIYYIDSGMKLPFSTCQQVLDYGGSCDPSGWVQLTDAQIAAFHTGPAILPVLGTVEGSRYLITAGTKREIVDAAAQAEAGIAPAMNVLTEESVSHLPLGVPVVRESIFVGKRGANDFVFLANGKSYGITAASADVFGARTRSIGTLQAESIAKLPQSPAGFQGVVTGPGSTAVQLLANNTRVTLAEPGLIAALAPVAVSQLVIDSYADRGAIRAGSLVKSEDNPTVYGVTGTELRPMHSWSALVALSGVSSPSILTVAGASIAPLPRGATALAPGSMYRTPGDPTVYLVDGLAERSVITNFDYPVQAGFTQLTVVTDDLLSKYAVKSVPMNYGVQCAGINYVAADGGLHALTGATAPLFPFTFTTLDPSTCGQTRIGAPAVDFIRTANGSIYQLVAGEKRPLSSMARFTQINGGRGWMQVADSFAAAFRTGVAA